MLEIFLSNQNTNFHQSIGRCPVDRSYLHCRQAASNRHGPNQSNPIHKPNQGVVQWTGKVYTADRQLLLQQIHTKKSEWGICHLRQWQFSILLIKPTLTFNNYSPLYTNSPTLTLLNPKFKFCVSIC